MLIADLHVGKLALQYSLVVNLIEIFYNKHQVGAEVEIHVLHFKRALLGVSKIKSETRVAERHRMLPKKIIVGLIIDRDK